MGVAGLWDILRPAATTRSLTELSVTEGFEANPHGVRGYRIGIDASIWFFHAEYGREGENPVLRTLFFRCATLMHSPFLPLFVFDGPKRPDVKRGKKINKTSHKLIPGMKQIVDAFGFECITAPGEAEAELAYLNHIGVIDGILSDDVDNFLFGAKTVIRNPSNNLSGNKSNPSLNSAGKDDKNHTRVYRLADINQNPDVLLTRGGMILIGLMSGGDYQQGGLSRCGTKTAHGLARCGFGDTLYTAAKNLSRERLPAFLDNWRNELRHELRTNSRGFIGRKSPTLANSIPEDFPDVDILLSYVNPITSESMGKTPPELRWTKEPDLAKLAATCEFYFEWGYREAIIKRFRTVIWHSAVLRILRRAVLNIEEAKSAKSMPATPRKGGERLESGTPSKMIAKHFSSLDIGTDSDDEKNEEETLIVQIHSSRMHASTDGVLEYRLEIAPRQLVEIAESGIKGTRIPEGPDEWASDEDNEEGSSSSKRVPKPPIDPETHLRVWMPACMVKVVEPHLVREFEEKEEKKKTKKAGKAAGTVSRARGKAKATDIDADRQPSKKPTKAKSANKASKSDHNYPASTSSSSEDELPASVAQTAPPKTKVKKVKVKNAIAFDQTGSAPPQSSIQSKPIPRDLTQGKKSAVTDMKTFFPTTKRATLHAPSKKIKDLFAEPSPPSTIDGERQTFKSSKPAPFPVAFLDLDNISESSSNSIPLHSRGTRCIGDLQDLSTFSPRKSKKCLASDSDSDSPTQRITKSPRKSSAHSSPSSKYGSHGRRAARPPSPTPINSVAHVLSNEVIELSSDSDCEPPPFQIMPTRNLPPLMAARAKAAAKARLPKVPTTSVAREKAKSIVEDIIDLT